MDVTKYIYISRHCFLPVCVYGSLYSYNQVHVATHASTSNNYNFKYIPEKHGWMHDEWRTCHWAVCPSHEVPRARQSHDGLASVEKQLSVRKEQDRSGGVQEERANLI